MFQDPKRHKKANPWKVTVPGYLKYLLKKGDSEESMKMYKFPWGGCHIVVDDEFWIALLGLDKVKRGWLTDMVSNEFIFNYSNLATDVLLNPFLLTCV